MTKKPTSPFLGPLFGFLLHRQTLPTLRTTARNDLTAIL